MFANLLVSKGIFVLAVVSPVLAGVNLRTLPTLFGITKLRYYHIIILLVTVFMLEKILSK
jgi:hypothetical protein